MLHHEEFPQYPPSGASSTQYENGKRGTKDSYEMDKDDNQQWKTAAQQWLTSFNETIYKNTLVIYFITSYHC